MTEKDAISCSGFGETDYWAELGGVRGCARRQGRTSVVPVGVPLSAVVHYVLDESRCADVIEGELAGVEQGVISCDRYSAYKKLARLHPGDIDQFRTGSLQIENDPPIPMHCRRCLFRPFLW